VITRPGNESSDRALSNERGSTGIHQATAEQELREQEVEIREIRSLLMIRLLLKQPLLFWRVGTSGDGICAIWPMEPVRRALSLTELPSACLYLPWRPLSGVVKLGVQF